MGMGNPIYKTEDPRAAFLKRMAESLGTKAGEPHWCRLSTEMERAAVQMFEAKDKKGIRPNIDFYSALGFHLMGCEYTEADRNR